MLAVFEPRIVNREQMESHGEVPQATNDQVVKDNYRSMVTRQLNVLEREHIGMNCSLHQLDDMHE